MNRTDISIALLSLGLVISVFVMTFHPDEAGVYALVGVNTEPPRRFDLRQDQLIHVQGPLGKTTLEIKDGKARFIDSPCPNKICIHSGWHSAAGDFAACLPNRVTLHIHGSDNGYDSLSY